MPKEKKKRGRREEEKRKRDEENIGDYAEPVKRPRMEGGDEGSYEGPTYGDQEGYTPFDQSGYREIQFYGLLDEQEQAYFKQADSTLNFNQFADSEEKDLFMKNIWKEARGKELKIANSQACSRLMERLIAASTPVQLKTLWMKLSTHFLNLFQHRFASHCCEALFRKAADVVTMELSASTSVATEGPDGEDLPLMETMFVSCVEELEGNLGYLITDQFASHPLRILLVVLSGMPLEDISTRSLLQSKKKEHNVSGTDPTDTKSTKRTRNVPESFQSAVETIIAGSTANLDTTSLRALATHPIANPVLQLLLTISLTRSSKQTALKDPHSILRLLIPEDTPTEDTESAAFVTHLLYDPIGSRLLEVIVTHAPGKTFKTLFRSLFKDRMSSMTRNDTASFVVIKILERLGASDLETVLPQICAEIPTLVQRSRTAVLRTLLERCQIRAIDTTPIATALETAYDAPPATRLHQILNLPSPSTPATHMSLERQNLLDTTTPTPTSQLNNSLLAQTLLASPGPLRDLITSALLATDTPTILSIAEDRTTSRVLQAALLTHDPDLKFPRLFLPQFYPHLLTLSTHPVASHVTDALWTASQPLRFIREHLAAELARGEATLRASLPGRAVWRNWNMDVYKTRRREWLDGSLDESEKNSRGGEERGREKTGIELARERFARKQVQMRGRGRGKDRDRGYGGGGERSHKVMPDGGDVGRVVGMEQTAV